MVSASLHAVTFDTICSSEVRAIHSSRARLRLTHLCRADQRSQCFTVVTSGPDDAVLPQVVAKTYPAVHAAMALVLAGRVGWFSRPQRVDCLGVLLVPTSGDCRPGQGAARLLRYAPALRILSHPDGRPGAPGASWWDTGRVTRAVLSEDLAAHQFSPHAPRENFLKARFVPRKFHQVRAARFWGGVRLGWVGITRPSPVLQRAGSSMRRRQRRVDSDATHSIHRPPARPRTAHTPD